MCPEHLPPTEIAAATPANIARVENTFAYPMIVKEVRSARGHGVHLIEDRAALEAFANDNETLYVQPRLPIDRDLRIVLVGDEVIAAYWRITPIGGYRTNVSRGGEIHHAPVPQAALDLVHRLARTLNVDHGGFDIAMIEGHPIVFEFNRLFGNQGITNASRTLGDAILRWLEEAGHRAHLYPYAQPSPCSSPALH